MFEVAECNFFLLCWFVFRNRNNYRSIFFPICSDRSMTADLTVMGLGWKNFPLWPFGNPGKKYFYGEPGNAQLDPEVQISRALLLGQALGHSFP